MILAVLDLVKTYPGVRAVDGISFEIAEATCFGLLGPNGAGKTTTVEMIEGVTDPTSGVILFRGKPRDRNYSERIGIQFQKTALPDFLKVTDVLQLFSKLYRQSLPIAELVRLRHPKAAWDTTWEALQGYGVGTLVQMLAGVAILGVWLVGVWVS